MLNKKESFRKIAATLEKSTTTISNEIKLHLVFKKSGAYGRAFCDCQNRYSCDKCFTCQNSACKISHKRSCTICYKFCNSYKKEVCHKLDKAPFVCNGCDTKTGSMAVIHKKGGYQAVYGTKAELISSEINNIIGL